jgi:hypothetical protein
MSVIQCSICNKQLEYLGDPRSMFGPFTSVLGGSEATFHAMEQWRGLVCTKCRKVYCVDCIGYEGLRPNPCPNCGKEPLPAQREYLSQAGIL